MADNQGVVEITMSELVEKLNNATLAYNEGHPIMSDEDWDRGYFLLQEAERKYGVYLPDSPTQFVNFISYDSELPKVEHNHKMLSLDKTKSVDEVKSFLGNQPFIAMCKMDGLTCSLRYLNGKLVSAETRGDGLIGEDILHNALVIRNIPNRIKYTDELIIDGEVICTYANFEEFKDDYKNPRNFAAGSIRLLNSEECDNRNLTFVAWEVIKGFDDTNLLSQKLFYLNNLGFTTVPIINTEVIDETFISLFPSIAHNLSYPIDGIVFKFDDITYGKSLGETAHHFKNAIAFKFYDETTTSSMKMIEWTMGRTGILTPVAVFDAIDIDGTIVERASLHNISIMKETLGENSWKGQKVEVYKANMIIPQIYSAEEDDGAEKEYFEIPSICPVCGAPTSIETSDTGTVNLICSNPDCDGKLINKLDHFCGKKGLDIKGLSKSTLEKLIDFGWLNSAIDIFDLSSHRDEWIKKPGFGAKSVDNILAAIEDSKNPSLEAFISSIGIPMIGHTISKELVKHISSYPQFREMIDNKYDFSQFEGFADSKTNAILDFDYTIADTIYNLIGVQEVAAAETTANQSLLNKSFVITGRLEEFKNRAELVETIESLGGKVVGSVSKNTDYLINNDNTSTSAKNLAAQKLGIPVLTEQDFKKMFDI